MTSSLSLTRPYATALNIAATVPATTRLGPGLRAAAWVQGCPFDCPGCIAPEWIPARPARPYSAAELAAELLADPRVTGLTFSGGEPMEQAAGLAEAAALARRERDLSLICFTGFRLERLRRDPPGPGVAELLAATDVLIDGRYVAALDDGRGLRGSTNQRVHHLTGRLRDARYDFEHRPRGADVTLAGGALTVIGIPPAGLLAAVDAAVQAAPAGSGPVARIDSTTTGSVTGSITTGEGAT